MFTAAEAPVAAAPVAAEAPEPDGLPPVASVEAGGGTAVRGRVRGAEGVPAAGAAVTLITLEGRQLDRSLAHADGSYAVAAPGEGTYVLVASADGCRPRATTLVIGVQPVTHDLLLSGAGGLAGAAVVLLVPLRLPVEATVAEA